MRGLPKNDKIKISHNGVVTAESDTVVVESSAEQVIKVANFVATSTKAQSYIQSLIKHISREVNRNKIDYTQLKYVFRSVRRQCGVEVSNQNARKLYELPTAAELSQFYGAIDEPIHKLVFEFLENTGLRVSELCNLEIRRIDFKSNLVFVSEGTGGNIP